MVYISIKSNIDCILDIVAILSQQPESLEEIEKRNKEMAQKKKKAYDYEFMDNLKKELQTYHAQNEGF